MPAVMLEKGRYWLGQPDKVFPKWKPSESCTYRAGAHTYTAFKFGKVYVAVIPEDAMPSDLPKQLSSTFYTFDESFVFHESNGVGYAGNVTL